LGSPRGFTGDTGKNGLGRKANARMIDRTASPRARFVVGVPQRTIYYNSYARTLHNNDLLRFYALGTRRGIPEVPPERTRLNPLIGLSGFLASKVLTPYRAESFRSRLLPWLDRWLKKQLIPGDHILSSYGYLNECFKFVRQNGGKTFLDAGNSHIEHYWELISEEHRRWNCPAPPFSPFWFERSRETLAQTDFVLSPSSYVTNSFLARGFKPGQILKNVYPVDFSLFKPGRETRPKNRPLTLVNTGSISLRKGSPYLLEAFRIIRRKIPDARLLLTRLIQDDIKPLLARYSDLPIEWSPGLPQAQLAERLRSADLFVLPSLEEGLVRTACEAMACGLPVILTPHTGANDFVQPGVNGEVVPIRDPSAIADAVCKWAEIILRPDYQPRGMIDPEPLTFEHFEKTFMNQLAGLGLAKVEMPPDKT
jgi:glycosyltransferase involved in cell wall biosynthesis